MSCNRARSTTNTILCSCALLTPFCAAVTFTSLCAPSRRLLSVRAPSTNIQSQSFSAFHPWLCIQRKQEGPSYCTMFFVFWLNTFLLLKKTIFHCTAFLLLLFLLLIFIQFIYHFVISNDMLSASWPLKSSVFNAVFELNGLVSWPSLLRPYAEMV